MNIGFVANGTAEEVLRRAARLGFDGVELCFGWGGPCDLERWAAGDTQRVRDLMAETGTKVLTVGSFGPVHLAPDRAVRERAAADMARAIELAPQLGTNVVTWMAFGDPSLPPEAQVGTFGQVFGEYARRAEDHGVRIGIENWPKVTTKDGIRIGNLAYSPAMFERLFDAVASKAVGLEFDPSHLYWQGADPIQTIRRFADRLVFLHAKDTEVLDDELGWVGMYGSGWWRYRLPGLGDLDWDAFARVLAEVGYRGGIVIEHEDPVFEGDRFEEGLAIGLKFLRQVLKS
jgi:sugar phosphate isomerase/epimerase